MGEKEYKEMLPLNCLLRMNSYYDSLKPAEKRAADFIINNPIFVAEHTISECASMAGCSEPTFIRFARRIGYKGFADLKNDIKGQEDQFKYNPRASRGIIDETNKNRENVVREVFELTIQTLKDTLEILDYDEYNKALEVLIAAKRVYFAGTGDASAVASAAAVKFTRIGYESQSFNDPDLMLMGASHMEKGDVYVLVSHSGRTKSMVNVAKYLKRSDVTTIAITNFPSTPLVKNSDICIFTSAFVQELKGEVMANRVVGLCIIESLFTDVVVRCKGKRRFIEKCENATKSNKL